MEETAHAAILNITGRFAAIEAAIRVLIASSDSPDDLRRQLLQSQEKIIKVFEASDNIDHQVMAIGMVDGLAAVLDT